MAASRRLIVTLVACLLGDVFCLPADSRLRRGAVDNEVDSADHILGEASPAKGVADSVATATSSNAELSKKNEDLNEAPPAPEVIQDIFGVPSSEDSPSDPSATLPSITEIKYEDAKKDYEASPAPASDEDDDDDDDEAFEFESESMQTSPTLGVGSNIFSLLSLANSLFGGSSGGGALMQRLMSAFVQDYLVGAVTFSPNEILRFKRDTNDNNIEESKTNHIDRYPLKLPTSLKPPPARQELETEESNSSESSENNSEESLEEGNNGSEESIENLDDGENGDNGGNGDKDNKDDDNSNGDSDYDDDEPPGGGDGEGGGILGLLAGLSGGEDGQSDLGSLLAAVSGIVVNLSGDGIDVNALIASGIGLFVGLLSEGEENPGAVIASYLLTSLETFTGGGADNNGKFFGKFLSTLIKGTSKVVNEDGSSEDANNMPMADSAGFFLSLLMGLLGDMSKGSSGGGHPWR